MQTRRWFLASLTAATLVVPRLSWGMQNIKCVVVDRKVRAQWTEDAKPLLGRSKELLKSTRGGEPLPERYISRLRTFAAQTREMGEGLQTEELKSVFLRVSDNLGNRARRLKETPRGDAAVENLKAVINTLDRHTQG